ncbi:MAG: GAF domain-containing protein [Sedimentisphaerales bacterium]|jgi:GAF domain-containing protein|nr:GAF domain-containing protein [Sedimentisphaerales bacterium]HNY80459.1 GAF domain-containing protein [Sedimentisphaerales bacterium]HOC65300.1 GAF domain-containing protein [Sedimentisphaerales bacterium]HOH66224.1 GAF domain-containing protein [Sedimentisphaerales bacterium]HPY49309.1 GAF domain-containing protein [Sedimentisphaerales bacterium]
MDPNEKQHLYDLTLGAIRELIEAETDPIAVMATVVCELHHRFDLFDWTGFYRVVSPGLMKVGPYQGPHGCLEISFDRGVCGAAARLRRTQIVPDVRAFPGYIACSTSTRSEIVVPVLTPQDELVAVLDIDSDQPDAFREVDRINLERLCRMVGRVG